MPYNQRQVRTGAALSPVSRQGAAPATDSRPPDRAAARRSTVVAR